MIFLQTNWILGFVAALTYWQMGHYEARHTSRRNHGPYWALASILVTMLVIQVAGGGWLLVILGQVVLLAGITAWRMLVER